MNSRQNARLVRNVHAVRAMAFFQVFMVIVPVAVPLFGDRGLDLAQVLELQALFGLTVVFGEVPSGYVADVFGRRLALIWGALFLGIGHSLLLVADDFATLALFEIALGVGVSLISGADVATLYDSQLCLGHDERTRREGLAGLFFTRQLAEAGAGLAASIVLLVADFELLVRIQCVIGWMPLLLAFRITEPPVERMSARSHGDSVIGVGRALLQADVLVRRTFLLLAVWSLSTFYAVWLLQHQMQAGAVPLASFGLAWALLGVIGALAGRQAVVLEAGIGAPRLLALVVLLPVLGYALLALVPAAAALLVAPLFWVSRGVGFVVLQGALNARLASRTRATANSLVGFVFRASFALTVPVVGGLLRAFSPVEVFVLLAAATLGVWLTLGRSLARAVEAGTAGSDTGEADTAEPPLGGDEAPAEDASRACGDDGAEIDGLPGAVR